MLLRRENVGGRKLLLCCRGRVLGWKGIRISCHCASCASSPPCSENGGRVLGFEGEYNLGGGGRGGSNGRASASRSNGCHDQRFESHLEHKKKIVGVFPPSQNVVLTRCLCAPPTRCIRMLKNIYAR